VATILRIFCLIISAVLKVPVMWNHL